MHQNRRLLLIDDTLAIHQDFRKILHSARSEPELERMEQALFGPAAHSAPIDFELHSAYQGQEGLEKIAASLASGLPYALAFVDMRMPPGWDGVETIERIWQRDPRVHVVICTAYSDYSWKAISERLDMADRLLILKKPFDPIEVFQLASTLTVKWAMAREAEAQTLGLEETVRHRTSEVVHAMQELKNTQQQLVFTEKMAAVGTLTAGIAHEIGNPTNFAHAGTQLLLGELQRMQERLRCLAAGEGDAATLDSLERGVEGLLAQAATILEGTSRIRNLLQDLRNFARRDHPEMRAVPISDGLLSTVQLAATRYAPMVNIRCDLPVNPLVECHPAQLNQVFMNLIMNACDAIEARLERAEGRRPGILDIRNRIQDGWLTIEFEDNGCGMPPATLARIFEPFFTTKTPGEGMGLGLAISFSVIERHGGEIGVDSAEGRGTVVTLRLPLPAASDSGGAAPLSGAPGNGNGSAEESG